MQQTGGILIFVLIGILVIAAGAHYFSIQKGKQIFPEQQKISTNFDVVVKENTADKNKSDVYLKDKKSGQETLFTTITDVYRGHYHNAEFKNDNLYIIQRTGGDLGYEDNPDWTDELWKYNSSKKGTKLYSNRGLDFRVSDDDKLIAIVGSGSSNAIGENIAFIDSNGTEIKKFTTDELGVDSISSLMWGKDAFWFGENARPTPTAFVKIDTTSYKFTKFDVQNLGIGKEFALNPNSQKIAYSDYPVFFDVDSVEEYKQSGKKVTLTVYDLVSKEKEEIDTFVTKEFNPKWVDSNTLEYDNSSGEGRVQNSIKPQ